MPSQTRNVAMQRWLADNFTLSPLFVLQGIYHFLRHRYMWPLFRTRLIPLTLLSVCVVTLLFLTTYLPQVAILSLFHGRDSAFANGAFLVLSEANLIIAILFEAFLVDKTQVDSFDAVLVAKGHADLVRTRRPVADEGSDPLDRLGPREKGAIFAPFSFRQIVEFVIFLPLNFIPYVGVPLFLLLTGYRAGPLLQYRYFMLKGFTKKERRAFAKTKSMRWQYMWFGTVYMILQLIPVLSMLFLLTSAAGSALWAAEMEDRRQRRPALEADDEEQPPAYTDYI
ncbi:hypothetical protein AAFC00_005296 [Neodothiora populina]|uniref:Uncharacterized protein n=1 Tax=Neodothiora populina TaxID=2781224 RepID=A0ABR3PKE8_9PEZI